MIFSLKTLIYKAFFICWSFANASNSTHLGKLTQIFYNTADKKPIKSRQKTDKKPNTFQLPADKKPVTARIFGFYRPIHQPISDQLPTVLQKADIL